jgi:Winged helix-turn-helix DNA-binding
MADLLDTIRSQIDARLEELRPLVEEAASLEAALAALERSDGMAAPPRPRRRTSPATSTGRRGRGRGETRKRLLEYVWANPGSTAADVATALGLNRHSVATRLAQLAKAGELVKTTRGYSASVSAWRASAARRSWVHE